MTLEEDGAAVGMRLGKLAGNGQTDDASSDDLYCVRTSSGQLTAGIAHAKRKVILAGL